MSLLDSMKKDVQALREEEQAAEARAAEKQRIFEELIQPSIHKAFKWFREFFEHLEILEQENSFSMELPGYGIMRELKPGDFFFKVEGKEQGGRMQCGRRIKGPPVSLRLTSNVQVDAMGQYLETTGLRYEKKIIRDRMEQPAGAIFEVTPDFTQAVILKGDLETSTIDLLVRNFQRLGKEHLKLAHDQLDQDLLDRIGLYVLGREDRIQHSTMTDHLRREIQRKLDKQNRQAARELENAFRQRKIEDDQDERERGALLKLTEVLRGKGGK